MIKPFSSGMFTLVSGAGVVSAFSGSSGSFPALWSIVQVDGVLLGLKNPAAAEGVQVSLQSIPLAEQ